MEKGRYYDTTLTFKVNKDTYDNLQTYIELQNLTLDEMMEIIIAFMIHFIESEGALAYDKIPEYNFDDPVDLTFRTNKQYFALFTKEVHKAGMNWEKGMWLATTLVMDIENQTYKYVKAGQ